MGFFNRKVSYPDLDQASPAAEQIDAVEQPLKELMGQVSDALEVVPANGEAFVFIGKPPKKFGMAMIKDDEVKSFVALAKEKGLDQPKIQKINEKFRSAYQSHAEDKRYKTSVAGKEIIITPSTQFAQEVGNIINSM